MAAIEYGTMLTIQCSGEYEDGEECPRTIELMFYLSGAGPWYCPDHEFQAPWAPIDWYDDDQVDRHIRGHSDGV